MSLPVILLGAGGHAKVVLDVLLLLNRKVLGVCDPQLASNGVSAWRSFPVLGADEEILNYSPSSIELANGVGSMPGSHLRRNLYKLFVKKGYRFTTLVHPTAVLGSGVSLGHGTQVMAGSIVQADCYIGDNTILNTAVRIDHDGYIGQHAHLAPGAVACGGVVVEEGAHIGPGSILIQGISVGVEAVVGAGTVVIRNVPSHHFQTGQPPRQAKSII
ncbi:acetyltransferase [Halomonas sp. KM-1]|uniref:acetyltransferase n=1 Tax=Halomonas sp. KM-1 TaxID=590061 RepID=UPI000287EC6C|nr:acetyltransferase [Halomonas sp. KM-1]